MEGNVKMFPIILLFLIAVSYARSVFSNKNPVDSLSLTNEASKTIRWYTPKNRDPIDSIRGELGNGHSHHESHGGALTSDLNAMHMQGGTVTTCNPGWYFPVPNGPCTLCPAGSYSAQGSTSCTPCPAGSISSSGASVCFKCVGGYYQNGNSCMKCPRGTSNPLPGQASLQACVGCQRGSYNNATGQSSCTLCSPGTASNLQNQTGYRVCKPCLAGSYSSSGASQCKLCEKGTFGGGSECELCPENTYLDSEGNTLQSACLSCAAGLITAIRGATSSSACFNPIPNYFFGSFALIISIVSSWIYLIRGPFHRISFLRRYRVVMPSRKLYDTFYVIVDSIQALVKEMHRSEEKRLTEFRTILFCVAAFFILVGTFIIFVFKINYVLFCGMIIYRGIIKVSIDVPFIDLISENIKLLVKTLNFQPLYVVLSPFIYLYNIFADFHINLSVVNVTCLGAQAPLQLLINIFVLGFTILVIESDALLLWVSSFSSCHHGYMDASLQQHFAADVLGIKTNFQFIRHIFELILTKLIIEANPLRNLLQYLMGFISIGVFTKHAGVHLWSSECTGRNYLDPFFAVSSTLVSFFLIPPTVYTIARVFIPSETENDLLALARDVRANRRLGTSSQDRSINDSKYCSSVCKSVFKFFAALCSIDLYFAAFSYTWSSKSLDRVMLNYIDRSTIGFDESPVKNILWSTYCECTEEEDEKWLEYNKKQLPSYQELCDCVYFIIRDTAEMCLSEKKIYRIVYRTLSFIFVFHWFTYLGRRCWALVFKKYALFLLVSLGIWTKSAIRSYSLISRYEDIASTGNLKKNIVFKPKSEDEERVSIAKFEVDVQNKLENFSLFLSGIVAPRAVLFQIIPQLSLLSIFAIDLSPTPLYFPSFPVSYNGQDVDSSTFLNGYIVWNPFEEARKRLIQELASTSIEGSNAAQETPSVWEVRLHGVLIFFQESRLLQILSNLTYFSLSVGVLFPGKMYFVIASIMLLLPQSLTRSISLVLLFAKSVGINFGDIFESKGSKGVQEETMKEGDYPYKAYNVPMSTINPLRSSKVEPITLVTYPMEALVYPGPYPEGVDVTKRESYLSDEDFEKHMGISKSEFEKWPPLRQTHLKKEKGLSDEEPDTSTTSADENTWKKKTHTNHKLDLFLLTLFRIIVYPSSSSSSYIYRYIYRY